MTLKCQLGNGEFPAAVQAAIDGPEGTWQEAVSGHIDKELRLLRSRQPQGTPRGSSQGGPGGTSGGSSDGIAPNPQGTPGGISGGSLRLSPQGSPQGSPGGSRGGGPDRRDWPETSDVEPAVLARMIKQAAERWEQDHGGRRLPAVQLSDAIKVRMSRDTAGNLLRQHCYLMGRGSARSEVKG